ncbi:MAG: hypothetical protein ACREO5_12555, partial [Candidatus Binatia bacterium]
MAELKLEQPDARSLADEGVGQILGPAPSHDGQASLTVAALPLFMPMERMFAALVILLTAYSSSFTQAVKPQFANTEELAAELKAAPCKNSQRADAARALF